MKTVIEMAREAGIDDWWDSGSDWRENFNEYLQAFAELVRADEREAIMDEWWMCVQSDLENGVKSLNERAAEKWKKAYPEISKFAAIIKARGNT